MRLQELVDVSNEVSEVSSRLRKIELLAGLLRRLSDSDPSEEQAAIATGFLCGAPRQGRLGLGGAALSAARPASAAAATLTLGDVDAAFTRIAGTAGAGSQAARGGLLADLLSRGA